MTIKLQFHRRLYWLMCVAFLLIALQKCSPIHAPEEKKAEFNLDSLFAKQLVLTNDAEFTEDRYLNGASSFLIRYRDTVFAVTAKHLIGADGGIVPEIDPHYLDGSIVHWEMYPRTSFHAETDTVSVSAQGLEYPQSPKDILLLKVVSKNFGITPLVPSFEVPILDEKLFLLGCPYGEKCRQNIYRLSFVELDAQQNQLTFTMEDDVALSGFSGAPIVNQKGKVVGVMVASGNFLGIHTLYATFIKEIENIR